MHLAPLVNLILDKLRTGRVVFLSVAGERVSFTYAGRSYEVFENHDGFISVMNVHGKMWLGDDNYNKWVAGVLNGMVRNDAGELIAKATA